MSLRDAHPVNPVRVLLAVAADDPSPLAEGTDGCGAGWSSPPKGRPLKTTNATKRRTAPNATAVRLTRSPQRFASPTVTASCSAVSFCGPGRRGGAEGLTARLRSRAALSTGRARRTTSPPGPRARTASCRAASFCCRGRRGGADGSTGTVSGSSRAVLSASRSSRAVSSTGRARRTTSPPGPRARTASCRAASFCCRGRRGGAEGLTGTVSGSSRAVLSASRSSRAVSSTGRSAANHLTAGPSRPSPLRAVQHRSAVSAAAAEPKAQRPPSPDLVAQSCPIRSSARCCQPVERGEPPHASAPAPLRAVQHRSAVSAAAAEPGVNGHRIQI